MPSKERVLEFVNAVVHGDHAKAIRDFYHEDATMQENLAPPRVGREFLINHEKAALSRLTKMFTHPPKRVLVDGDNVVIEWVFDATDTEGVTRRLNEIAVQEWRNDKVFKERFIYDTKTAWQTV